MNNLKTGVKPDRLDIRDYRAEVLFGAFDYPETYSLRSAIGKIKHQGRSGSCVGHTFAYYAEVLNYLETGKKVELSPRDIYSIIHKPIWGGGAWLSDGAAKIAGTGVIPEELAPSCLEEECMRNRKDLTPKAIEAGYEFLAKKAYVRWQQNSFEGLKSAIFHGNGTAFGAYVTNEGWKMFMVRPPLKGEAVYGHAIYACGYGKDYIEFVNSWGINWGDRGFGRMGKEYFEQQQTFNPWTLEDAPNETWSKTKTSAINAIELAQEIIKKVQDFLWKQ
jgi:C1A family cysteine protease